MKASEFVKKFGWDAVKDVIQKYTKSTHVTNDACMFINSSEYKKHAPWFADDVDMMVSFDDLKRIVESHELVAIHGFEKSKEIVANAPSDDHFYSWTLGNSGVRDKTVNIGMLRKAIADVESCL